MDFFILEESLNDKLYRIGINHSLFKTYSHYKEGDKFYGSFNIFAARVMGLSYANYLRMCRDIYEAILTGKNEKYPIAYFKKENAEKLIKILNQRIGLIKEK